MVSTALLVAGLAYANALAGWIVDSMRVLAAAQERSLQALRALSAERDRVAESAQRLGNERQQLEHLATHDMLTGLVNRSHFDDLLRERVAACRGQAGRLSLLYIDLDRFKHVNDRHGHAIGDALLRSVAARVKAAVRASDVVGRLGGDEFGVILDQAMPERARQTADELMRRIARPFQFGQLKVEITASVGLADYPAGGDCAEALLATADAAMYRAKLAARVPPVTQ